MLNTGNTSSAGPFSIAMLYSLPEGTTWGNYIYFLWVFKNEPTNYAHLDRHQTLQGGAGLVIVLALFFFGVGLVVPWRGPNGLIKFD